MENKKPIIEDLMESTDDSSSEIDPNPLSPSSATHEGYDRNTPLSPSQSNENNFSFNEDHDSSDPDEAIDIEYKYIRNYVIYRKPRKRSKKRVQKYKFSLPDRYKPCRIVGEGAYGFVLGCIDRFSGQKVAVKVIQLYEVELGEKKTRTRRFHKCILRELLILKHFRGHKNVIGLIDVFFGNSHGKEIYCLTDETDGDFLYKSYNFDVIYVVTDLMDTDIYYLITEESPFPEDLIRKITYDSLKGLKYIHAAKVFHRDVKLQNILYRKKDGVSKICDFGLSRGVDFDCKMSTDYVITRWYRSPEILMKYERCNQSADIWSIGCVLAEMCSGLRGVSRVLFKGNSWVNQLEKIIKIRGTQREEDMHGIPSAKRFIRDLGTQQKLNLGEKFKKTNNEVELSEDCLSLLDKLLDFNPHRRISAKEALEHPWFKDLVEEDKMKGEFEIKDPTKFTTRIPESCPLERIRERLFEEVELWKSQCPYYNERNTMFIVLKKTIRLVEEEVEFGKE